MFKYNMRQQMTKPHNRQRTTPVCHVQHSCDIDILVTLQHGGHIDKRKITCNMLRVEDVYYKLKLCIIVGHVMSLPMQ